MSTNKVLSVKDLCQDMFLPAQGRTDCYNVKL